MQGNKRGTAPSEVRWPFGSIINNMGNDWCGRWEMGGRHTRGCQDTIQRMVQRMVGMAFALDV